MEETDNQTRIKAAIDGFFVGLQVADPSAGFGSSEPFDSAFWSVFSLLESNSEKSSTVDSLLRRMSIILDCEDLSNESRRMLEGFQNSGDLWGGGSSTRCDAMSRTLGVSLCESVRDRRVERAAEIVAITHFTPLVVQASIALVEFQASLLLGHSAEVAVDSALEVVDHPEIREALLVEDELGYNALSPNDSVVEVVRWVVWAAYQDAPSYILLEEISAGSERNPVVVSLCGAVLGSQSRESAFRSCADLRSEEIANQIVYCRESLNS